MSSTSSSDSSLLLWFLAALVYWLAAHVALGGLRDLQRGATLATARRPVLVGGLAIGAALCTGIVLSLTSLGLNVLLGFRFDAGAGLWLLAAAAGVAIVAGLAWRREQAAWVAGGVALALLATFVQWGWVAAAGFRPGISWSGKFIAAAGVLMATGASIALALGLGENAQHGRQRGRWRLAASVLLALSWVLGQELLLAGASLGTQVGSLYRQQLTAPMLSMLLGTLVPLALLVALFDQKQLRRQRSRYSRSRQPGSQPGQQLGLAHLAPRSGGHRRSRSGRPASRAPATTVAAAPAGAQTQPTPPVASGQPEQPASTIGGL
jgi:hypothetical protein